MTNYTNTYAFSNHNDDTIKTSDTEKYTSPFIERVRKGYKRFYCVRGVLETEQNCNILTPHSYGHNSVSFPFSWAAQPGAWGPSLSGTCSSFQHLLSSWSDLQLTDFLSLRGLSLFDVHLLLVGVTNRTHSTRPRSRLYPDITRPDAPVIYTGAFPILTAWPGSVWMQFQAKAPWKDMNPSVLCPSRSK